MPFRRRSSRRSFSRKAPNLLWVPEVGNSAWSETLNARVLCDADSWEAQFTGINFERATLLRIVGEIGFAQNNAGSNTGAAVHFGIFLVSQNATAAPDPTDEAAMGENDCLHWGHILAQASTSGTNNPLQTRFIDIKTKRRLTSDTNIVLSFRCTADAAAPSGNLTNTIRTLISRR